MKIQGRKSTPLGPTGPTGAPVPTEGGPVEEPQAVDGDTIDISSTSRGVGQLKQAVDALPDVRTDRIEGIRDQVEEGSYHVESEKLAKRVVDEAFGDALRREHQARGNSAE